MEIPKTILLVEDAEPLNHAIIFKVKQYGCNIISTANAEEALKVLETDNTIDIVWLDIFLPKMNGIEFLKEIRRRGIDKKVVICVMSDNEEFKDAAKELGVVDYLIKSSYELDDLVNKVIAYA